MVNTHRVRLRQYQPPNMSMQDIINLIDKHLRSASSKKAFSKI